MSLNEGGKNGQQVETRRTQVTLIDPNILSISFSAETRLSFKHCYHVSPVE